ncbi:MAG: HAMP domain-containing protein [Proteobacteria bacterium]|nr:HAMP domain-containing protein [Pseudomonadota bacterium]
MRRLFWRVFALLWIATLVLIVAIAWSASYTFENEKIPGLDITRMDSVLNDQLRDASRALHAGGTAALREVQRSASERGIDLHVLDVHDKDILDNETYEDLASEADNAVADEQGLHSGHNRLRLIALPDGSRYTAIASYQTHPLLRMLVLRPTYFWNQITIASLISAIFALILAAYVSAPLSRIQAIARRVASGDLDARIGPLHFGRSAEMLSLANEFDGMAARLKELVEGQRRLIRDVSHEMRSPLARQRVALELARDQTPSGDVRLQLDRIERESERLEEMIAQAIQLSRMETTQPARVERVALDALVADIADDASFEAQARRCSLRIERTMPLVVNAEADLLGSAIENIVRNAVNYTRTDTSIRIRLQQVEREARLCVIDSGPGVPEADLVRIFEPYYRTDDARARKSGGSGLGLAIAKRAIERQGGRIRASNALGGGLEVEIVMPLA